MPKVFYKATERMLVINGQELPADPVQAKRVMVVFGLKLGDILDLYTGEVYRHGELHGINMAFIMPEVLHRPEGEEED